MRSVPSMTRNVSSVFSWWCHIVAFELHDFELVVVHLGNDPRLPLGAKHSELLSKVDRSIVHALSPNRLTLDELARLESTRSGEMYCAKANEPTRRTTDTD